ncbi:MAG: CPBP family glutamic-type intramembrane protease [Acidobacteriota bacterium]|nr:CPBP family glutamic-type intramembrane protease [Acidobacteriota bacterium]MDH3528317.1 CPBP family glutamic-type intramembrane protease [Acidobacteriota bacterium]
MTASALLILITVLFAALSAIIAVRFYWQNRNTTHIRRPRTALASGSQILVQQVVVLIAIILFTVFGGFGLYDLGASRTIHPVFSFVIGFGVYFVVLGVIEAAAAGLGIRERLHQLSYDTMRMIWPRDPNQKILAFLAVCLLNPFTEEVIYRGVLVHHLGGLIENIFAAVLIGFVLSIAAHMYQGSWSIPFQMAFHSVAILLLLSPLGLIACFGFHFAGDLVPVMLLKKSMHERRERFRKERASSV